MIRDLNRAVKRIVKETGAKLKAEMAQQRAREGIATRQANPEYCYGPAPLGFEKDDSHLVAAENHNRVVKRLELVQKGNLSKREAARELDTS